MTKHSTGLYYCYYDTTLGVAEEVYIAVSRSVDTGNGVNIDSDEYTVAVIL